ncbi:restriction endonuclease subunit S [Paramuribaculum intestinale]|uniref:Restriction endonuclease subunit S n=4 Tax=Muribaculaceae TaxID=2005473 RepID=A0A2V1IUT2_9BACT|nr:restriction endonuclease subunit S [Paramuribaculum intestinale]PWB06635.1 restriction endonuclease subunit S [Paramuribaculum intestinale]WLT40989.1 restriction endonuclease subunit S [Paramuribaculum intestinale]
MDTQKLRQRILDLAIRGKLLPQDPNDEPASVLLDRIRAEKERLIAEGKLKRPKAKKSTDKSHYQNFTPPFDIPESWQWVKIDEIASSNIGLTYSPQDIVDDGVPVYRSNNIRDNKICLDDIVYVSCPILEKQYLNNGDLLICARNGSRRLVGKNVIIENLERPTSFGAFMAVCRSCYNPWIKLLLDSAYFNSYLDESNSTAINQITQKMLLDFILPLPPKEEQSRIISAFHSIVGVIDGIDQSKKNLSESIANLKSKILDLAMQGKLVPQDPADEPAAEMLRRVNPKAKIITDNPHYPQLPDNWVLTTIDSVCDYGYSENVNVDEIALSEWILELEDIEKDSGCVVAQRSKKDRTVNGVRHRFVKGDVLYSKLRTYLNKVLVAPTDGYCTTEIIPVKSYDCVIPEYLCAWLRSPFFLSYTAECCYGVKMPRLSTTDARKGIIPIPPINEQKRITQKLSKISELLSNLSISID